jgi:tetratricopeptide (TPR) repeat protein
MSSEQEWTPRVRRVEVGAHEPDRIKYVVSLIREDRLDEAMDEVLSILRQDENAVQARMLLGAVHLRRQSHAEALEQFRRVIAIDPMVVQAHIRAGACCLRLDDVEEARRLLQTALDLDRKQAQAHVGMAQVLAQTGEPQRAIGHLEEALRYDPRLAQARMLMARLLSESGDIDGAIEELTTLVNDSPGHAGGTMRLAMMHARKGNYDRTAELLDSAVKANPDSAQVWDLVGRTKMVIEDFAGAEAAFLKTAELNPQDRTIPIRLTDALIRQRKLDQAREILKTIPRRGRLTTVVHQRYGDIYLAQEAYQDAVRSYRAAILHHDDGDRLLAEIEAAAGPSADDRGKIAHFHAAFAKLREERRKQDDGDDRGRGARR